MNSIALNTFLYGLFSSSWVRYILIFDYLFSLSCRLFKLLQIDIELRKFIKRYTNGCIDEHGSRKVLKLKDWPSENDVEEFLLCQRPEFLHKLPLLEYFHPKCGFLNLSAKLPLDSAPRDAGPKFLISCGMSEEHENIYILNLRISMGDAVRVYLVFLHFFLVYLSNIYTLMRFNSM